MQNKWQEDDAGKYIGEYAPPWGEELALRIYSSRLLGSEPSLVLHGGGNTSLKSTIANVFGEKIPAIFVKASGRDLKSIQPEGLAALDLKYLKELLKLTDLSDEVMVNELRTHLFDYSSPTPSVEAFAHIFLPPKYIDHTHADAILALTNQVDGKGKVREALGDRVIILDYLHPGFQLAKASSEAFEKNPRSRAMVWMHHGLVTWGETARESYDNMIELVTRAEEYLKRKSVKSFARSPVTSLEIAEARAVKIAPMLRGLLAEPTDDSDHPYRRVILRPLITREALNFVDSPQGKSLALTPPLTSDHLIRTKPLPLWVDDPPHDDAAKMKAQLQTALADYATGYHDYVNRHAHRLKPEVKRFDPLPRVVMLPGVGVFCAGRDVKAANIVHDITAQTLTAKTMIAGMGEYEGLSEEQLFDMEYWRLQHAKLDVSEPPLGRQVALVTGAAGAIGWGICRALLEQGCHVAASDISQENLDNFVSELKSIGGSRIIGVRLDVTDPDSVAAGFAEIILTWGGLDLVVLNAGIALVCSLAEMNLEAFRKLQRVNVEGILLVLSEAARHFQMQGTGGDVVLISTKNVFAPGAKFGAYSATKAAAHQLARIASLELAELGVRVNMVAPDAVFSGGTHKSGLWAEVGPDRMRARGLDEKGLEEYYRSRNLLKAKITAEHVGRAVLYFATRQTPTTGATIPVDGGLPDATPR